MPEQHDVDEGGKFPEEHLAGQAKHDGAAVDIRRCDSDADEHPHPGLAGLDLLDEALEKRPAAVPKDHGRKSEQHVDVARKAGGFAQSHQ